MISILLALIYLTFVALGLPDSLLGSAWPNIYTELNVPLSFMSFVAITISFMTIVSSLLTDKLTQKFGSGLVVAFSVALTAVGLLGFNFVTQYWMFFIWSIPYGLGAGAVDATLNNYVALHFKAKHMSWLHCMWGVGAFVSPNIMAYALSHSGWHQGYFIVFVIQAIFSLILFLSLPIWKKFEKQTDETKLEADERSHLGVLGLLKLNGALFVFIAFFSYCAIETTIFQWTTTFFVMKHDLDTDFAANLTSLYYLGMMLGRLICGFLTAKFNNKSLIRIGSLGIFIGVIILFFSNNYILSTVAFAIIGLGCAPIYPCIMHNTPILFGKENSQSMIGVQMAFAYFAYVAIPPVLGLLLQNFGPYILPISITIFLFLQITLYEIMLSKRKTK